MGRTAKGLNKYLDISTKGPKKKQNTRFAITENNNQDFRKLLNKFNNTPYLGYKSKQTDIEPTEAYFFLIKDITEIIKSKRHVQFCTKGFKLGINIKIEHVNNTIKS